MYSGLQKPNYSVAQAFYSLAWTLAPDWGNPFNQLAVVETYHSNDFGALYYYVRSLAIPRSFPTSKGNIDALLKKIQKAEDGKGAAAYNLGTVTTKKAWQEGFVRMLATVWPLLQRWESVLCQSPCSFLADVS